MSIPNYNFITYEVVRNEKSDHYYNLRDAPDDERIIVIIEFQLNEITSICEELKVDLLIERGIDTYHIIQETPDFIAYLMLFESPYVMRIFDYDRG